MTPEDLEAEIARLLREARALPIPPPPDFDEAAYLAANPDVAAAVAKGIYATGFKHYLLHGRAEGRARPTRAP